MTAVFKIHLFVLLMIIDNNSLDLRIVYIFLLQYL